MLPTLPAELLAAICRVAAQILVRDSRAAAVQVAASSSIAYKAAAPILYRVLHISSKNYVGFQALFDDNAAASKLDGTAAERVCRRTKHLIVTAHDWRPTRDQMASFSTLQTMSGSPLFLRHVLQPNRHESLPSTLKKIHIWDLVYIGNLPHSITHVSVRFPGPSYTPYVSGPIDLGVPPKYTVAGREPGIQHIGFEIIDRFGPGALILNEVTMRQLLARIFNTSTNPDLQVTFRGTGRAAVFNSWDRYVRAVDSLSDSEKALVRAWRDERAIDEYSSYRYTATGDSYDSGLDLRLALDDAWEERDMWNTASPLSAEDFKRARVSGRFVPEHDMGRMQQTARKSVGGQVPLSYRQTARKSTGSESESSNRGRGRGLGRGRGRGRGV